MWTGRRRACSCTAAAAAGCASCAAAGGQPAANSAWGMPASRCTTASVSAGSSASPCCCCCPACCLPCWRCCLPCRPQPRRCRPPPPPLAASQLHSSAEPGWLMLSAMRMSESASCGLPSAASRAGVKHSRAASFASAEWRASAIPSAAGFSRRAGAQRAQQMAGRQPATPEHASCARYRPQSSP